MIGDGQFQAQIAACGQLLDELNLLDERNYSPNKRLGAADFKGLTYRGQYLTCIKQFAYDYRLTNQSLLLYVKSGTDIHDGSLGFSYYDCPIPVAAYEDFVLRELGVDPASADAAGTIQEVGDELRTLYEQYIYSTDAVVPANPIRYDYKAADYRPAAHPASHVHFGISSQIRVGTERIMNPVSFTLFVVRQHFPRKWERYVDRNPDAAVVCRNVRDHLELVDATYRTPLDAHELHLS